MVAVPSLNTLILVIVILPLAAITPVFITTPLVPLIVSDPLAVIVVPEAIVDVVELNSHYKA